MKVFNAKILQVDASDSLKDSVVARGYHIAFGDEDVFVDVLDVQDKCISANPDDEFRGLLAQAIKDGCHYIHLY